MHCLILNGNPKPSGFDDYLARFAQALDLLRQGRVETQDAAGGHKDLDNDQGQSQDQQEYGPDERIQIHKRANMG